jgi:hypothetical protein
MLRLGPETSMHYFLSSGGPSAVSIKCPSVHVTLILCFYIRWDLLARYCIQVHPGRETSTDYFFTWDRCSFQKSASMFYFSCSGGTDTDSTKSAPGNVMPKLFSFASGEICK